MVYYRTDILKKPASSRRRPGTTISPIAKAANGKDMNGDGKPDYGSCISKKRNAQAYWFDHLDRRRLISSRRAPAQGAFFDTARHEAARRTTTAFARPRSTSSRSRPSTGRPTRSISTSAIRAALFVSGHCALKLDWGDVGMLAIDPKQSKVIDKVGAVILPGSKKVLNRDTGKLVPCDKRPARMPIDGVNHAPFAAFGGWRGGINAKAKPKVKDAAYAFFSYMSQPAQSNVDVTIGATGFNPYRRSQFTDMATVEKGGHERDGGESYLGAIKASLKSPNMILDLRIPQNQKYQQVVLDEAVARFLAGESTRMRR